MAKNRNTKKRNGSSSMAASQLTMAKNRTRKKRNGSSSMDIEDDGVCNITQAMDTSESGNQKLASGPHNLKLKKGRQMKRSKNVRKMKARAKAMAINDKSAEKVSKNESKTKRVQLAKTLYE